MSKASVRTVAMMVVVLAGALACRAGSAAPTPTPAADEARAATLAKETAVVAEDVSGEFRRCFSM